MFAVRCSSTWKLTLDLLLVQEELLPNCRSWTRFPSSMLASDYAAGTSSAWSPENADPEWIGRMFRPGGTCTRTDTEISCSWVGSSVASRCDSPGPSGCAGGGAMSGSEWSCRGTGWFTCEKAFTSAPWAHWCWSASGAVAGFRRPGWSWRWTGGCRVRRLRSSSPSRWWGTSGWNP